MRLLLRWAITAAALAVAVLVVPGITVGHDAILAVAVTAIVVGLVNVFVRPVMAALGCGLIVLTLGLFLLVINGLALWLAAYISQHWLHVSFHVSGFWAAFFGALIVSVVSWLLSLAVKDQLKGRKTRRA